MEYVTNPFCQEWGIFHANVQPLKKKKNVCLFALCVVYFKNTSESGLAFSSFLSVWICTGIALQNKYSMSSDFERAYLLLYKRFTVATGNLS